MNTSRYFKLLRKAGIHRFGLAAYGVFVAQCLHLVATPILTRIYGPAVFGEYGVFLSVVAVGGSIACLRLEMAIPIPGKEEDADKIYLLSMFIAAMVSGVILVAIAMIVIIFSNWQNAKWVPSGILFLAPVAILLTGITQASTYRHLRNQKLGVVSLSRIGCSGSAASMQWILSFKMINGFGLIFGDILGRALACCILVRPLWGRSLNTARTTLATKTAIKSLVKTYRGLIIGSTCSIFLNQIALNFPMFWVAAFYGKSDAGQFAVTIRVAGAILALVATPMSQVFVADFANNKNFENYSMLFNKTILKSSLLAAPPLVVLSFCAKPVFSIIFGDLWEASGSIFTIMVPMLFFQLLSASTVPIYDLLQLQWWRAAREAMFLCVLGVIIYLVYRYELPSNQFFVLMSASYAAVYLASLLVVGYVLRRRVCHV